MRYLNRPSLKHSLTSCSFVATAVAMMASSCGHTQETLDAFEQQKSGASSTSGGTTTDSTTSDSGETTGGGEGYPDEAYAKAPQCETPKVDGLPQFSCEAVASQQFDEASMKGYCVPDSVKADVNKVLSSMSPAQKASQLLGVPVGNKNYRDIERSPDTEVAGVGTVRGYRYRDAGRGVNLDAGQDNRPDDKSNFATAFPAASLRAASWDLDLERRVGAAIGDETAASKNNMNLGPCMNIVRHPYWGRTQETYGEDMYAIGRMTSAYSVGVQEYVVGCAKHWAANNIEKNRSSQNANMTEQTLREVYGRHFEMVVQDGSMGCIMASYNLVNGTKATQNKHLLRDILKAPIEEGGFGFEGLVITDWWAMPGDQETNVDPSTAQSVTDEALIAGTDIEVPWQIHYSEATLTNSAQDLVEEAASRILTQKFLFNSAMDDDPWSRKRPTTQLDGGSLVPNEAHEALAEEGVVKSAVLLANGIDDNGPVLPLANTSSIAVIGPKQYFEQISSSVPPTCGYTEDAGQGTIAKRECTFDHARDVALGDRGSSRVNADPERSIGPFAGIAAGAPEGVTVTAGETAAEAQAAETVVVVVGYTPGDEGEEYYIAAGGDRSSLDLPAGQNDLVSSVLDLNKPTIIIVQSGSVVNLPWLSHANKNQATFWGGYPGMRAGAAYARLIFGQDNFSGKFPMSWPTQAELDKQAFKETDTITNMDYYFGYRLYDKIQYMDGGAVDLVFPFGHGLSYSTFEYANLMVPCETVTKEAIFEVSVDITNTSDVDGDEVALLFIKPPPAPEGITGERPWKELKSFARVSVPAGQTVQAKLPVRVRDLRRWEGGEDGRWVIDSGEYTILVGKDADDAETGTIAGTVTINGD